MDDPLEAIEQLPVEAKIAVIVSVLRTTRNQLTRIEKKLDWVNRSIWTLVATIISGIVVYAVTTGSHAPHATPPATTHLPAVRLTAGP